MLNTNVSLYVKKADRINISPELADTFLNILKTKLSIFVKLNHALSVTLPWEKNMPSINITEIVSDLEPHSTEALE